MTPVTKYERWYWKIIDGAENRGWSKKTAPCYVEGHHPYPRGIFGKRDNKWVVFVTAREHYILHLLLSKFTPLRMPMFWRKYTSRQFSPARIIASNQNRGEMHPRYGKNHTDEVKTRLKNNPNNRSLSGKIAITDGVTQKFIYPDDEIPEGWRKGGVKESEESRQNKANVDPAKRGVNKGRQFSEEWIANMRRAQLSKPLISCEVCEKQVRGNGALANHMRKHDSSELLKMSLTAQVREANKKRIKGKKLF